MGLAPQLSDYQDKYNHFKFRREDGILEVRMHSNDSDLVWGFGPDEECGFMLEDIGRDAEQRRIFFQRLAVRVAQHFRVKRFLVAKMIIDRRDVRARAPANLAHRRIAKTNLRKNLARRLQKLAARFVGTGVP